MANRLTTLAASINDGVSKLNAYLSDNDLPCPSFDPDASTHAPLQGEAQGLALALLSATQEIHDLLRGPRELPIDHHVSGHALYGIRPYISLTRNSVPLSLFTISSCASALRKKFPLMVISATPSLRWQPGSSNQL